LLKVLTYYIVYSDNKISRVWGPLADTD